MKYIILALCLTGCFYLSEADIHKMHVAGDAFSKKMGMENTTCETNPSYPYMQCSGTLGKKPASFICYSDGNCHWNNPRL